MPLRNGAHGYGSVTKALHWVTLALMTVQFGIGYAMDAGDSVDRADDRLDARDDACESADDAAEDRCEEGVERREDALQEAGDYAPFDGGFDVLDVHVVLGLAVLALAVARTVWRLATPLPPWDDRLTAVDRRVAHATEVTLIASQYVIPLSGLWLVTAGDDAVLPLHVAGHLAFFAALAVHVGLVLRRRLLGRML